MRFNKQLKIKKNTLFIVLTILALVFFITISAICNQCSAETESPTIELQIYDGPDYSASDDMCYYRVEAIATGFPDPEVIFNYDNNVNPLDSSRVEVGIEEGDSYILTATATNDSGTATTSIILSGEYGEEMTKEETEEEEAKSEEEAEEEKEEDEEEKKPTEEESKEEPGTCCLC